MLAVLEVMFDGSLDLGEKVLLQQLAVRERTTLDMTTT